MLADLKATLDAYHPAAFHAALVVLVGATIFGWRKLHPSSFERLPKTLQDFPAVALGAGMGALSTGMDPIAALAGAFAGLAAIGGHHALKRSPLPYGNPKAPETSRRITIPDGPRSGPLAALLLLASMAPNLLGCGSLPGPLNAANVDPVLRMLGYCRDAGAPVQRVASAIDAYNRGDQFDALTQAAALLGELKAAGVEVPDQAIAADMIAALAKIQEVETVVRAIEAMSRAKDAVAPLTPENATPVEAPEPAL